MCGLVRPLEKAQVTCFVPVQALAPKLESMEAAWAGLHTLTGADTPEEIIAFLKGPFYRSNMQSDLAESQLAL